MTQRGPVKKHGNRGLFLTREELEIIMDWAKALSELAEENDCTIVVEGPRDMQSLTSMGVRGHFKFVREIIKSLKEGVQDDFCGQTYILLTDFDKEGKFLHLYLKATLNSLGARVIEWPRIRYLSLGLPPRIEEAYNFVRRRRNK